MQVSDFIENRTFDEIAVGESTSLTRTLSKDDIALFAVISGDTAHLDERYAETSVFHRIIAHAALAGRDLPVWRFVLGDACHRCHGLFRRG